MLLELCVREATHRSRPPVVPVFAIPNVRLYANDDARSAQNFIHALTQVQPCGLLLSEPSVSTSPQFRVATPCLRRLEHVRVCVGIDAAVQEEQKVANHIGALRVSSTPVDRQRGAHQDAGRELFPDHLDARILQYRMNPLVRLADESAFIFRTYSDEKHTDPKRGPTPTLHP